MKNTDFTLILPCYNEAEHFQKSAQFILNTLKHARLNFQIIFVEDKSTDLTKDLIIEFVKKNRQENIVVIYHKQNIGRGATVRDGILKASNEIVGFIDIDCEVSPKYIPDFINKLNQGYDIVCGERIYITTASSLLRAIASKLYSFVLRSLISTRLIDTEAGYKFFRREAILPVLAKVDDTGWFWDTEIMVRSERAKLRIASLPVQFERRSDKTSTVRLMQDTITYLQKLIAFQFKLRSESV